MQDVTHVCDKLSLDVDKKPSRPLTNTEICSVVRSHPDPLQFQGPTRQIRFSAVHQLTLSFCSSSFIQPHQRKLPNGANISTEQNGGGEMKKPLPTIGRKNQLKIFINESSVFDALPPEGIEVHWQSMLVFILAAYHAAISPDSLDFFI